VFSRLADFYKMFDVDAREASALLDPTLTQRAGEPMWRPLMPRAPTCPGWKN
jgi:DNA mismatch repair ATPase MutS